MSSSRTIVSPFRGIRYRLTHPQLLSELIAPPYDVISEGIQRELHARHAHNFVRVELPSGTPAADESQDDRYTSAAACLRQWLSEGVLQRDESAAFYLLEQEFKLADHVWRRRGVFVLVRLPQEGENYVLPHEGTLREPKADRLDLMRSCQAATSPILAMCEDRDGSLLDLLQNVRGTPEGVAEDPTGVVHRVCLLQDTQAIDAICAAIGPGPLFIADGHHRFDTAVSYRDEMRRNSTRASPDAAYNYGLALVTSVRDEALRILPTHRLISGLDEDSKEAVRCRMGEHFEVHRFPLPNPAALGRQPWLEGMSAERHVFGAYCGDSHYYVLTARDETLHDSKSIVDRLDVSILHRHLVDPVLLGMGKEPDSDGRVSHDSDALEISGRRARLTYVTDERQAVAAVDRGDYDFAFFLRPTQVGDLLAAARAGERMPGKSTYFYPKVPAGIVISDASTEPI
jgi:uncharacterized protein (DUF1015 family)